jgi:Ca-activated chloride channel family protein
VRVTIEDDFAITEVDETFFNPSSEKVEGIYRFRTPEGATLHRFGVDREGVVMWGRVKEKAAAAAQYQANVYEGSTEDPALLEWDAPGVYRARLYPIGPGESRRVVVRYAEWLGRSGARGERRLYVYPMAADGSESSLPHIEELTARIDLAKAGATEVRVGMAGSRDGNVVVVRAQDHVPRADLSVELFDAGTKSARGYRAVHRPDLEALPPSQRAEATRLAQNEADYLLVPVRAADVPAPAGGLDLAIVVDASAATDAPALALARAATNALLAHLGKDDRAAVWAGDDALRPLLEDRAELAPVDEATRRRISATLANLERGGASDLGAMLAAAAQKLDPARRGAVVYIGDGVPTVGELGLVELSERMSKQARPTRVFALGIGDAADMGILKGLARGAFAERVGDESGAARAALRLLEQAERPVWLGTSVDLGGSVERIFPRELSAMVADESVLVVGRLLPGALPSSVLVRGPHGEQESSLAVAALDDRGDLRQRWAEGRLAQLIDEGTGRAAMVDLGSRHGIITPVTSFYVPTTNEMTAEERSELQRRRIADRSRNRGGSSKLDQTLDAEDEVAAVANADNKEGGTGTRAKGEEGSMGRPSSQRFGIAGPRSEAAAVAASPPAAALPMATAAAQPLQAKAASGADMPSPPKQVMAAAEGDFDKRGHGDGQPAAAPAPSEQREQGLAKGPAPAASAAPAGNLERQADLRDAAEFGMIGLLNAGAGGDPNAPTAPWGRDDSLAADPVSARGNQWGDQIGEAAGAGGLGLSGIGAGGGGKSDAGGLGTIGTLGHGAGTGTGQGFGSGSGRLGGAHIIKPPQVRMGATQVNGRLPPEVIQRIVRQNFGRFRLCYENGLRNNPNLQGRVSVRFEIDANGAVGQVGNAGSDLPDAGVVGCVSRAFHGLSFPPPEGGKVSVVYPVLFSPGDGAPDAGADKAKTMAMAPKVPLILKTGDVARVRIACGGAADVPLEERILLWRERLARVGGNAAAVASVYRSALAACEAPTWRARAQLLSMLLDAMPNAAGRVQLWRTMFKDLGAADYLYRGMLARVKTPADMRDLSAALGLRTVEPSVLEKALKEAKTPAERVGKLRTLVAAWPDDTQLALRLLDALEDVDDVPAARELGRKLRARADADARLRTAIGELYLRLAHKAGEGPVKQSYLAEARRAFGEIVEFAPDDPVARRRLGDLLRAHGWFAEASRQYETLARLAPDDASVALLLAAAAEGRGLLEEAVKWTEKGGAAGAPDVDQGPASTARAFAATYLAWGRLAARESGKVDEEKTLAARAARVLSGASLGSASKPRGGVRVALTWSHPEFHPTLWTDALGAPMPAPEGDVTLGIAQAVLPPRDGLKLEVRLEPDEVEHAARLGAVAMLTVAWDEGDDGARIVKMPLTFAAGGPAKITLTLAGKEVRRD